MNLIYNCKASQSTRVFCYILFPTFFVILLGKPANGLQMISSISNCYMENWSQDNHTRMELIFWWRKKRKKKRRRKRKRIKKVGGGGKMRYFNEWFSLMLSESWLRNKVASIFIPFLFMKKVQRRSYFLCQDTEKVSINKNIQPWLLWLSGLGVVPQTKRSPVQFLIRAHAWVVGHILVGEVRSNQLMFFLHIDVSLPFSLPFPLSKNK